jgi:Uma2 family endonuclease
MVGDRTVYRLSVDDVTAMVEAGVITEDTPVELLEGVLVDVSPKSPDHSRALEAIDDWLLPLRNAGRHAVRIEQPVAVPDRTSLPEPNVAVVARVARRSSHPSTAFLVVEIAISSYATDTGIKSALYAAAGVPDYWVIDVARQRLEVRREPVGTEYRRLEVLGPGQSVSALALDLPALELDVLFHG